MTQISLSLLSIIAHRHLSLQQQGSGNVPADACASETNLFQQLNQNQMGETMGVAVIGGIFKGAFADGRYL